MRLALLLPTSMDIAWPIRSGPATSPIITRRTELSVAQPMPFQKLAAPRCQIWSCPVQASKVSTTELASSISTTTISVVRRCVRSSAAPNQAPNRPIGSKRSMVIIATRNAEPVCW